MDDLQATKLCAEALGWKHLGAVGVELSEEERHSPSEVDKKYPGKLWCLSGGNDWWLHPEGSHICGRCESIPDPLHDDAQAMALVKRLSLCIKPMGDQPMWGVRHHQRDTSRYIDVRDPDLNRAIVYCVAALQKAKGE